MTLLQIIIATSTVTATAAQPSQPKPEVQYRALLKQFNRDAGGFRKAKSDRERREHFDRFAKYPAKFLDIAEKNPKDAIALVALRQAIQTVSSTDSAGMNAWEENRTEFPQGLHDGSVERIIKVIRRDHLRSDKLGPIIDRLRYQYRIEYEPLLLQLAMKSPHRNIRGLARLALARFLNDRRRMADLVVDRPELKKRYAVLFGKNYLKVSQQLAGVKRIEGIFKNATQFKDVDGPLGETVANQAKAELYELRHLSIGKQVPEIIGKDQDGKTFKLSDYRGKVVLLYFWAEF